MVTSWRVVEAFWVAPGGTEASLGPVVMWWMWQTSLLPMRTASVQEGPDNPSDNIGHSVHAYGHLTPSIDGVGADYVDTADPLAFHNSVAG